MARSSRIDLNGLVHALLYRRVSGAEHQKEGLSLAAQETTTRGYAARKPDWVIAGEYQDVMTGRRADRPDYQHLLDHARQLSRARKRVAVVVIRLNRLGRNKPEYFRAEAELGHLGVEIHSIKDGGVLDATHAGVLAVFAAKEAQQIGENVAATRSELVNDGWHYGKVPFGYRKRAATPEEVAAGVARRMATPNAVAHVFEPEPAHARVVRAVFDRVADGESIERVAKWLASLPPEQRGQRLWPAQCVATMLRSASYVARPAEGDEDILARPAARWQPLVSDELFARVQARFATHTRRPHQATGRFLLTGFARCPECGERMVAQSAVAHNRPLKDGSQVRRSSYRCTAWARGANASDGRCRYQVPMAQSDAAVTEQVAHVLDGLARLDPKVLQARVQREYDALQAPGVSGSQQRAVAKAERDISQAQERLGKGAIALMDGTLDQAGYAALRDQVTRDLSRAEEIQRRLLAQTASPRAARDLGKVSDVLARAGGWAPLFAGADVTQRRAILDKLIERVRVQRVGYRQYAAEIDWSAEGKLLLAVANAATR